MADDICAIRNTTERKIEIPFDGVPQLWAPGQTLVFQRGVGVLLLTKHPGLKEVQLVPKEEAPAPVAEPPIEERLSDAPGGNPNRRPRRKLTV